MKYECTFINQITGKRRVVVIDPSQLSQDEREWAERHVGGLAHPSAQTAAVRRAARDIPPGFTWAGVQVFRMH
jgi:hypothetical protein